MIRTLHGKARGRSIELDEDLNLADGQEIEVQVRLMPKKGRTPGEGLLRTEGALADDPYWDEIMAEIYQERKTDTRKEVIE